MPRPVTHFINSDRRGDSVYGHTLCGREATVRYRMTGIMSEVSCPKCIKALVKSGLMPAPVVRDQFDGADQNEMDFYRRMGL